MKRFLISFALIALSVILMAYGAYRGEVDAFFQKAKVICMECIGIG